MRPLSGVEALQGSCSDQLLLDSPWWGFNVCREIYCCEVNYIVVYLVLHSVMFWFSRDTLQYAEITTQAWHSSCNIHLDHYAKVIPVTDLYMPTVRMVGISNSPGRNMWLKPSQAYCSLEGSFCWFFGFSGTEPRYIPTSPPAGLASWGRPYMLVIILEKAVCITWWLPGRAMYLKEKSPSSPPYVEISWTFFVPLDARSCISSLSFITLTHLLWAFFPCRGLFLSEAGCISLGLL